MAKPRRKPRSLKIRPEDRLVGVVPREKRDLLAGCNEPGKPWFHRDDFEFAKMFCRLCKNADCMRAKGSVSPWHTRMAEQVDYLLNDPHLSEITSEEHRQFAQMAFDDISQKAMRLEVARHRQDWTIPDTPSDGIDKVASPETTDQFDDAVRALAEAKGMKAPKLDRPEQADAPAHFEQADDEVIPSEDEWEYDTMYPSSDGKSSYHVTLSKEGAWKCECKGFHHLQKCKHLVTVRAWYDNELAQAEEAEELERQEAQVRQEARARAATAPPPARPARDPRVPDTNYNTPMPQGGVMVGGGVPPPDSRQQHSSSREPEDPWAPRKDNVRVVKPGAVVTLKEDKKDE